MNHAWYALSAGSTGRFATHTKASRWPGARISVTDAPPCSPCELEAVPWAKACTRLACRPLSVFEAEPPNWLAPNTAPLTSRTAAAAAIAVAHCQRGRLRGRARIGRGSAAIRSSRPVFTEGSGTMSSTTSGSSEATRSICESSAVQSTQVARWACTSTASPSGSTPRASSARRSNGCSRFSVNRHQPLRLKDAAEL